MKLTRRHFVAGGTSAAVLAAASPTVAQTNLPPLRIGFGEALTGGLAAGGKAALLTYQIWAEEVNARGGILGRKVELVYYDDQSNPSMVPAIYTKLLDIDKVDLVMSGYATVPTAAAMPIIVQRKRLFMSLFALAVNEQFKYDRYFQIQPNGPNAKLEFSKGYLELAMALDPKPTTIAMVGADAEYSHLALAGARENAKKHGLKIVYDRTYPPATIDFLPIIRGMKAANPDIIFLASYPPDSVGLIRAAHEVGIKARMFGGGTIGPQFAALKTQLGPLLNNVISYDLYAPEPTMKFPGIEELLRRYRERAAAAGVDPLGLYIPPFAYAQMQILEAAIKAVGSLDEGKLAEHMHKATFPTVVGDVKFAANGEWAEPRLLLVQYQGIVGNDVEQFKQPGKQVIIYPPQFKSGEMKVPFDSTKK
ncbi:MAG TPA: amino acid ABC transporter substrate-binding protein [Xanthobacteraceae bacterium]|nr:amino acid ABC transporter substrate-binding protein [Xanthobacteraceae bacterium]